MTSNFEVTSPQQTLSEEVANRTNEHQLFEERLEAALEDTNMHQALERFAPSWRTSRSNVFASEESDYGSEYSFASMRSALRKAKDNAIEHQEELIAQFKAQAELQGQSFTKHVQQRMLTAIFTNCASVRALTLLSNQRQWLAKKPS